MKDQHTQIRGYRDLSQEEINLMNEIKDTGIVLGSLIEKLQLYKQLDQRFVALGKTDLQTGIMYLVRAVAQPTTF